MRQDELAVFPETCSTLSATGKIFSNSHDPSNLGDTQRDGGGKIYHRPLFIRFKVIIKIYAGWCFALIPANLIVLRPCCEMMRSWWRWFNQEFNFSVRGKFRLSKTNKDLALFASIMAEMVRKKVKQSPINAVVLVTTVSFACVIPCLGEHHLSWDGKQDQQSSYKQWLRNRCELWKGSKNIQSSSLKQLICFNWPSKIAACMNCQKLSLE